MSEPTTPPSTPPATPPSSSSKVSITLPTPPSFAAHRSRSHSVDPYPFARTFDPVTVPPLTSAAIGTGAGAGAQAEDEAASMMQRQLSISSVHDPIVSDSERRGRRVSFNRNSTNVIGSKPAAIASKTITKDSEGGGSLKSPLYKTPQRQRMEPEDHDHIEQLISPAPPLSSDTSSPNQMPRSTLHRRPLSYQGPRTLNDTALSPTSPSRLASTAASRGLSIAPALTKINDNPNSGTGATVGNIEFGSIWSGGAISSSRSGWITPGMTSATSLLNGSASSVARQRGLAVALVKDGGDVVPVTSGLGSDGTTALKSPLGSGIQVMKGLDSAGSLAGLRSARSPGIPKGANADGSKKREIILCKFYHTPGLTCTSRPCRFVHALDSIASPSLGPSSTSAKPSLSAYQMLSPTPPDQNLFNGRVNVSPDPTSGTFAQAQMQSPTPKKTLRIRDSADVGEIGLGERVVVEDHEGKELVGTVFLMSGGGKGASGKGREKYKTVPCRDYVEGHCPYGDYCSFIHDDENTPHVTGDESNARTEPKCNRLTHRKSSSLGSPSSAWTRALTKSTFSSSIEIPYTFPNGNDGRLSAFAPPFLPSRVEEASSGDHISALPSSIPAKPSIPAAADEKSTAAAVPNIAAPVKSSTWSKGPPLTLRKVASLKQIEKLEAANTGSEQELTVKTPTMPTHLIPPPSAASTFGSDSDPATPYDPVVLRRKVQQLEEETRARQYSRSNLSTIAFEAGPPLPSSPACAMARTAHPMDGSAHASALMQNPMPYNAPTYPWGMPMSPVSPQGYQDPSIPNIPGGLGVMWTPAGWAVQDAAMKNALRSTEAKTKYGDVRRREPKEYFRTRPCKFFADGYCPHGNECTYMHTIPPLSPEQSSIASPVSNSSEIQYLPLSPPAEPHPKHKTLPCKFFNSASGCSSGGSCSFLHTRVVPDNVPLVEKPRPWRTKPCRHFQLGRCVLGDACHFAHKPDPAWLASGNNSTGSSAAMSRGSSGSSGHSQSRGIWEGAAAARGNGMKMLTADQVERTLQEMRSYRREVEKEDEDDDVEIVTQDISLNSSRSFTGFDSFTSRMSF
ncbi:hypothetical protein IAR55_002208 [Kwoniella newhampshirensis]|uniref:C3H1-type domain-containing protein n=1 Tax=Kwoniella newhampshirensis TaxID=1651941 RepID=A0AAW0YT25_9TREE